MKQSSPSRKPRSRNNSRKPSRSSGQSSGNRTENRVRGNPKQLLDKYKTQAREARQAGDRVLAENYHQFADHYQRVINEMRLGCGGVFEEYREVQKREDVAEDFEDAVADDFADDGEALSSDSEMDDAGPDREDRQDRQAARGDRVSRSERAARADEADNAARSGRGPRGDSRGPARGRRRRISVDETAAQTDVSDLPSIIASDEPSAAQSDEKAEERPVKRRPRRKAAADADTSDALSLGIDEPSVKPETDAA